VIAPDQIVLLAAGMGTRLGELGGGMPKALFDAAGQRLIDRALAFAALLAGEKIVVGGFQHERLAAHLGERADIRLLENTRYRAGNLLTLVTALPAITGSMLVMNIDHVYRPAVADRIRAQAGEHVTAFVDFDRSLGADDMKVTLDGAGHVAKISKQLATWDCGYVGMTFIPAARLARYRQAIADVQAAIGDAAHVEQVLQRLADDGEPVAIGDISGIGWYELDTPEDVAKALPELERL
jgi:L-glutamine-phosphate cytidylyltransferase